MMCLHIAGSDSNPSGFTVILSGIVIISGSSRGLIVIISDSSRVSYRDYIRFERSIKGELNLETGELNLETEGIEFRNRI